MAYITGTITDANPGPALYTAMSSALTTAGYTLVDTVVISTRTHKIWKSAAASNTLNLDWYLDVSYPTTGVTSGLGGFSVQPFEFFDPATDLGYRGCLGAAAGASSVIDGTTYSRYGATGSALETNWIGGSAQTAYQIALVTSVFTYYVSATPDRLVVMLSNSPTVVMYAGFHAPDSSHAAKAGAALYPLVGLRLVATNGTMATTHPTAASISAGMTRIPPLTAFTTGSWTAVLKTYAMDVADLPTLAGGATTLSGFGAWPVELRTNGLSPSARFGTLRDLMVIPGGTVARGDTVTIAGATWVCTTASGGAALLFKAT